MGSLGRGLVLAGAMGLLWGCGTFPLPKVYVLGDPSLSMAGVADEAGLPHIELKRVTVPDYLDTTDILRRTGSNEVVASPTGRWGERVSLGLTRVLATDLARRLPKVVIESRGTVEPALRLLVDVERFEIDANGRCTLTARWRLAALDDTLNANSKRGTFVETATSGTDAAAASAMTSAIDQLARQITLTVQASAPTSGAATSPPTPPAAAPRSPRPPPPRTPGP